MRSQPALALLRIPSTLDIKYGPRGKKLWFCIADCVSPLALSWVLRLRIPEGLECFTLMVTWDEIDG